MKTCDRWAVNIQERSIYKVLKCMVLNGLLLCIIGGCLTLAAQPVINLQAALDSSKANNLTLRNEVLKSEYYNLRVKMAVNIPQMQVFTENGQMNSRYTDHRFGLSQTINFPTVYSRQKNVFDQEYRISLTNLSLKELDLKKQVMVTYYHLVYLQEKENILLKNDTVYSIFQDKASLRHKAGESNILERTTAEIERSKIAMQLRELQQDKAIYLLQLQWLMNTQRPYKASTGLFKMELPDYDSTLVSTHPQMRILMQEKQSAVAQTRLEKNRLLPDISITYSNMSMYGVGADNIFYNHDTRFQAIQVGVGIPLFSSGQRAAVQVSRSQEKIAESDYQVAINTINNQWDKTIALYRKYQETLNYYETIGIRNADLMIRTVNLQYAAGEINYLNWVTLTNQALEVKSEYLDAVNNHNETIIELMYLMGQ